jgi:cobalamin biosynthetic protein CobC
MKTLFNQHGGKIDAAVASFGGKKAEWLDLSTGINPNSYPLTKFKKNVWEALPDDETFRNILSAAKLFWNLPTSSSILCSSGASALIALIPFLYTYRTVTIEGPTYSEHEASFRNAGFSLVPKDGDVQIIVNPNNPDGRLHLKNKVIKNHRKLTIIDESFCDTTK